MPRVAVIGAGFSGLSAACVLAQAGMDVTVVERHNIPGGRARSFEANGFFFDMGPSWYWMPDVFENFFQRFDKQAADFYALRRLDPSYQVIYPDGIQRDIPADLQELKHLFESIEPGSAAVLEKLLQEARTKYQIAMHEMVYLPGLSLRELCKLQLLKHVFSMDLFKSMRTIANTHFKSSQLRQLIEFPVLFLGAKPSDTPALYSLMNYADMSLGTWYPMGGMFQVVKGIEHLARSLGVRFLYDSEVKAVEFNDQGIRALGITSGRLACDYVMVSGDYHHFEQHLLPAEKRRYQAKYWNSRTFAPSCLIYYLGINRKVEGLRHHNLFFDTGFDKHASQIYDEPAWPSAPQFYVCCPSKTDPSVAPDGKENVFVLIPVANGLSDSQEIRHHYFHHVMNRMQRHCDIDISSIIYRRSYAHSNFTSDYFAFKGNAYGLANTLKQTAHLKPSIINKKVPNLFYTGQLTVPGPGVPPALISGQLAATQLLQTTQSNVMR
ncbi:MAG: phytoene desaturase family protein [Chryseolinea sp.]